MPCEPPEVGPPCAWCEVRRASMCSVLLLARYMYVSESQKTDCTVLPSIHSTQTDLPEWPNPIRHEPWSYWKQTTCLYFLSNNPIQLRIHRKHHPAIGLWVCTYCTYCTCVPTPVGPMEQTSFRMKGLDVFFGLTKL